MARIRSIKPEFPHSESMGNVSRDARLTFIQLWTLADDEGRLRGNSRMLASLLFPYDDDAKDLIDVWLGELEREKCILRYSIDGTHYVQILNWLMHQKIDKPSKSKIPPFGESSRILANPHEGSSEDLRIKDQGLEGNGEDRGADAPIALANSKQPTPEGEMAIALRDLGVVVRSIDPVLIAWVRDKFSTQQAIDAVGIARIRKPHPESIPANYLDKILRQPARPPPAQTPLASRITWRPPDDDDGANGCTPQNSTPSNKH
jgi:hypothetical protein